MTSLFPHKPKFHNSSPQHRNKIEDLATFRSEFDLDTEVSNVDLLHTFLFPDHEFPLQDVLLGPPLCSPVLDRRPPPRRSPQLSGKEVDDVDEGPEDPSDAAHDHGVVRLRHQVQGRHRHGRRHARQLRVARQIRRLGASH